MLRTDNSHVFPHFPLELVVPLPSCPRNPAVSAGLPSALSHLSVLNTSAWRWKRILGEQVAVGFSFHFCPELHVYSNAACDAWRVTATGSPCAFIQLSAFRVAHVKKNHYNDLFPLKEHS